MCGKFLAPYNRDESHSKAVMHYIPRIFANLMLLAAFFLSMQALADQPLVIPAGAGGANPSSAAAAERQAVVPGNYQSLIPAAKISPVEPETHGMRWLLLGGVGLGLVFFWLGRRSGVASAPRDISSRAAPPSPAKLAVARVPYPGGAVNVDETRYWMPLDKTTTVTVDELSSVEEEAEIFLLQGRMDMAIGVLRHHVEADGAAPAHVWMSLLDVLHAQGLRQEFEKLAPEIRERFGVALPTWENANARSNELTGLEHFPRLFAQITAHWNSPDCLDYLRSLTQDNRNGERGGLHLEAFRELLVLIGVLEYKAKMAALHVVPA